MRPPPQAVVPTLLRLDPETRAMLDEFARDHRQTLTAAATEVFHAGFRVLTSQRAALESSSVCAP